MARECAGRLRGDFRSTGWRARAASGPGNGEMQFQVAAPQLSGVMAGVICSLIPGPIGAAHLLGRWEPTMSAAPSSNVSRATSAVRRRATPAVHPARCAIVKPCSPGARPAVYRTGRPITCRAPAGARELGRPTPALTQARLSIFPWFVGEARVLRGFGRSVLSSPGPLVVDAFTTSSVFASRRPSTISREPQCGTCAPHGSPRS